MPTTDTMKERLFMAAKKHGEESEPEMEITDLQDLVNLCWNKLNETQRREVYEESSELLTNLL